MGFWNRLFRRREALRATSDHVRAFAPDPKHDYWPLTVDGDNAAAIDRLRREGLTLVRVTDGATVTLPQFGTGIVLFATGWEPFSAQTIGKLSSVRQSGMQIGVVFFEETVEDTRERRNSAWYFEQTYVLGAASAPLKREIQRVPLRAKIVDGKATTFRDGIG